MSGVGKRMDFDLRFSFFFFALGSGLGYFFSSCSCCILREKIPLSRFWMFVSRTNVFWRAGFSSFVYGLYLDVPPVLFVRTDI